MSNTQKLTNLIENFSRDIDEKEPYLNILKNPPHLLYSLKKLSSTIGNSSLKDDIAEQINHLLMLKKRSFQENKDYTGKEILNCCLYGPPGTGKTTIAECLANIYYSLGYLKRDETSFSDKVTKIIGRTIGDDEINSSSSGDEFSIEGIYFFLLVGYIIYLVISFAYGFYQKNGWKYLLIALLFLLFLILIGYLWYRYHKNTNNENLQNLYKEEPQIEKMTEDNMITVVSRDAFVDRYVGGTDKKTKQLLNANLGKVVFIDEAYSLCTGEHDTYGKEAINTLNLFITENQGRIIVIMAGYREMMVNSIFAAQPGLVRRFPYNFVCNGYNSKELLQIFNLQLFARQYTTLVQDQEKILELFKKNHSNLTAFGGDTQNLANFSAIENSTDNLKIGGIYSPVIKYRHIENAMNKLLRNKMDENSHEDKKKNLLSDLSKLLPR